MRDIDVNRMLRIAFSKPADEIMAILSEDPDPGGLEEKILACNLDEKSKVIIGRMIMFTATVTAWESSEHPEVNTH